MKALPYLIIALGLIIMFAPTSLSIWYTGQGERSFGAFQINGFDPEYWTADKEPVTSPTVNLGFIALAHPSEIEAVKVRIKPLHHETFRDVPLTKVGHALWKAEYKLPYAEDYQLVGMVQYHGTWYSDHAEALIHYKTKSSPLPFRPINVTAPTLFIGAGVIGLGLILLRREIRQ